MRSSHILGRPRHAPWQGTVWGLAARVLHSVSVTKGKGLQSLNLSHASSSKIDESVVVGCLAAKICTLENCFYTKPPCRFIRQHTDRLHDSTNNGLLPGERRASHALPTFPLPFRNSAGIYGSVVFASQTQKKKSLLLQRRFRSTNAHSTHASTILRSLIGPAISLVAILICLRPHHDRFFCMGTRA